MKKKLMFKQDKTFKIVQFTDVHWVNGCEDDLKTNRLMERILEQEKPDMVVFTGDMVYGEENDIYLRKALEPVNNSGIPWAAVFGNHDAEIGKGKDILLKVQQESSLCLTEAGETGVSGLGNYNIQIYDSTGTNPRWNLYFLDSGGLNENAGVEGYDYIKRDQIDWYIKTSKEIERAYGRVPALSFFHIPLPEYNDVWNFEVCYGMKNEEVCCPNQNSGLFSAMLEMGDVEGIFVGHDHINDYWGELYGIKLLYGRATGYNTYGADDFYHGARVINLKQDSREFETWIRLEDGIIVNNPVKHRPEKRTGSI